MKKIKGFVSGLIVGAIVTTAGTAVWAEDGLQKIEAYLRPSLPITLDGEQVKLENAPVMVDGSTYLRLRDVAALTGLGVNWNEKTQTVQLSTAGDIPITMEGDEMDQATKDKLQKWEQDRQESLKEQAEYEKQQEEFKKQQEEDKAKLKAELDEAEAQRQKALADYERIKAELEKQDQEQQQNASTP